MDPRGEFAFLISVIVDLAVAYSAYVALHDPLKKLGHALENWWNEPHWWDFPEDVSEDTPYYEAKKSGKEKASDAPSWAKGERPAPKQKCQDFAKQLLNAKYGAGNWQKVPGTEYNKIVKRCQRSLK